jgi:hypothetical protein
MQQLRKSLVNPQSASGRLLHEYVLGEALKRQWTIVNQHSWRLHGETQTQTVIQRGNVTIKLQANLTECKVWQPDRDERKYNIAWVSDWKAWKLVGKQFSILNANRYEECEFQAWLDQVLAYLDTPMEPPPPKGFW